MTDVEMAFGDIEHRNQVIELFPGHAFRLETSLVCTQVDLSGFVQRVDHIEAIHDVRSGGQDAVFFPEDDIVLFQASDGRPSQIERAGDLVRYNAQSQGHDDAAFGNHGPQGTGNFGRVEKTAGVGQGHQFRGMGVENDFSSPSGSFHERMHQQVGGKFRGGANRLRRDDPVAFPVFRDADQSSVVQGFLGNVAHSFSGAGNEEHFPGQFGNSLQQFDFRGRSG